MIIDNLQTNDQVIIEDWYDSSAPVRPESLTTQDKVLVLDQLDQLRNEMAAFSSAGEPNDDSVTSIDNDNLQTALAAAWV